MRYRMPNGGIVDTRRARQSWGQKETGRREHSGQRVYESRKSRYYIEYWADDQPSRLHWLTDLEATQWMQLNGIEVPAALTARTGRVV